MSELTGKLPMVQSLDCKRHSQIGERSKAAIFLHLCLAPRPSVMGKCPKGQNDTGENVCEKILLGNLVIEKEIESKVYH